MALLNRKIDPKLAKAIEADMAEEDKKTEVKANTKPDTVESVDCECVSKLPGAGLLDTNTICPACDGNGKLAKLAQG